MNTTSTSANPYATLALAKRLRTEPTSLELIDAIEDAADHDGLEIMNARAHRIEEQKRELLQRICEVLLKDGAFSSMRLVDRQLLEMALYQCPEI